MDIIGRSYTLATSGSLGLMLVTIMQEFQGGVYTMRCCTNELSEA